MAEQHHMVSCSSCGEVRPSALAASANKGPCPSCGHEGVQIDVQIDESIEIHDQQKLRQKRDGVKKPILETQSGSDWHRGSESWSRLERVIDREHDWYSEDIVMADGTEIHVAEPLSEHWGHGSAKGQPTAPRPACRALIDLWDRAIAEFLNGGPAVPPDLRAWSRSYSGRGDGEVIFDAMPEPFLGSLDGTPAGVVLALNPGRAHLDFQARDGIFAKEVAEAGSYSAWAKSWPYLRDPWHSAKGRNGHHWNRLNFLRRWHEDPTLGPEAMVGFELFPWHSTSVKGSMRPDPATINTHVLEPLRELGAPVFAFGAEWLGLLEHRLGLPVVDRLGRGGRDYGSDAPSRSVVVFEDRGLTVIAESHSGGAGPPNPRETELLRTALETRPEVAPPAQRRPPRTARQDTPTRAPVTTRATCPNCFTVLPLNGVCGSCV